MHRGWTGTGDGRVATAQLQRQLWVYFRKAARVAWTRVALPFRPVEITHAVSRRGTFILPTGRNQRGTYQARHFRQRWTAF